MCAVFEIIIVSGIRIIVIVAVAVPRKIPSMMRNIIMTAIPHIVCKIRMVIVNTCIHNRNNYLA